MTTTKAKIATLIILAFGMTGMLFGCASQPGPQEDSAQSAGAPLTAISSIAASETDEGVVVTIAADRPLTFSSLKQPDPLAVVLYFPETTAGQAKITSPRTVDLIPLISARQGNGQQRTARVEIQLAGDAAYLAVQEGNTVQVRFSKAAMAKMGGPQDQSSTDQSSTMADAASQETPQASQSVATRPAAPAATPATAPQQTVSNQKVANTGAWVNKIDFLSEAEGKSTLVVGTTHAVDYRLVKTGPRKIQLRLLNTRIPSYRQRPLITTRFNSAVDRVIPAQPTKAQNESVISIELREAVPYVAEQTDNLLMVHFEASNVPPKPLEQANLPAWKRVLSETESQVMPPAGAADGRLAPLPPAR